MPKTAVAHRNFTVFPAPHGRHARRWCMLTVAVVHAEDVQTVRDGAILKIAKPYWLRHCPTIPPARLLQYFKTTVGGWLPLL